MFPLIALAALASAFGAYQYGRRKGENKAASTITNTKTSTAQTDDSSAAKNVNTYNYYTNESETGNTLFGSQKKTKRTLFGGDTQSV